MHKLLTVSLRFHTDGFCASQVEGENLGCDGKCFTSKQCDDVYWPPIIMLLSATCIGFSMIIVVSGLRRRLFWRMVAERERAEGQNRRRHGQRTEELLASLATVVYDPDKEDMLQELGLVIRTNICGIWFVVLVKI